MFWDFKIQNSVRMIEGLDNGDSRFYCTKIIDDNTVKKFSDIAQYQVVLCNAWLK